MKLRWDLWFYGLVSAVVGGGAGAVTSAVGVNMIAPDRFNLATGSGAHNIAYLMLVVFGINAMLGFFAYLAAHPAPDWDGTEHRANGSVILTQQSIAVTAPPQSTVTVEDKKVS